MVEQADEFLMQEGLLYTQPKYGRVFVLKETTTTRKVEACKDLRSAISDIWENNDAHDFNVVAGFDPQVWEDTMKQLATGWAAAAGVLEKREKEENMVKDSVKFKNTGGFACIMVRSSIDDMDLFEKKLKPFAIDLKSISKKNNLRMTTTICEAKDALSGVFVDGIGNKSEPIALQEAISCNPGVNGHAGGSYMLQQKFRFTWEILSQKNADDIATMIGRHKNNTMLMGKSERTHIKCVHKVETDVHSRSKFRIHRISMPFEDEEEIEDTPGGFGGGNKESGLFYISFSKSTKYIQQLLEAMTGTTPGVTTDLLISVTSCLEGAYYYLPAMSEFDADSPGSQPDNDLLFDHFDLKPSSNPYLFYNHKEYLNRMTTSKNAHILKESDALNETYPDPPSQRILHLVKSMFENWEDTWFHRRHADEIHHLKDHPVKDANIDIMLEPIIIRQATAIRLTLEEVYTTNILDESLPESYGVKHDLFRIHPKDILAGKMPVYGLGVGQLAMPYLIPDTENELSAENILAYSKKLNEVSGFGHVVPNYQRVIQMGLPAYLLQLETYYFNAVKNSKSQQYYDCCRIAFKGVKNYILNYANLAQYLAIKGADKTDVDLAVSSEDIENFNNIRNRLRWLALGNDGTTSGDGKPRDFLEATQLLLTLHSCLHLCSEPVSIGRIDVILEEFFDESEPSNQDVIDAFWIKIGEKVQLNRETRLDLYTVGTIAVPYRSDGRFPRGDGGNQWVQQVTIGGYDSTGAAPSAKRIAIANLCLNAARRLPLNAPCVSLRMHKDMDDGLVREAAKVILSGGAHPVLPHDDRLVPALESAGFSREYALNYSSDGCYEPIIPGKTEFSFCYVALLQVLEMTINRGATISEAGPAGMRGYTVSQELKTPFGSGDIKCLDDIKKQFAKHLRLQMHDMVSGLLMNYGNIYNIYASPLLSGMIDGCLESGKDIYNGGAELKMIGLMAITFANTVDSLYAIHELCFGDKSMISFDQLVKVLQSDWGYGLQEPLHDPTDGKLARQIKGINMELIREFALNLPKMGLKTREEARIGDKLSSYTPVKLKEIADWLAKECVAAFNEITTGDKYPFYNQRKNLEETHGKFNFVLGSGTFEGYVGWGLGCAASADGRRKGQPVASDMSPSPIPQDLPESPRRIEDIYKIFEYYDIEELKTSYSNGCEVGVTIDENTSEHNLYKFLRHYADGEKNIGGNLITITCANQETYLAAIANPEQYDLLRVRTGGWTEFYVSFFSPHQQQHLRRTYAFVSGDGESCEKERRKRKQEQRKEKREKRRERRKKAKR